MGPCGNLLASALLCPDCQKVNMWKYVMGTFTMWPAAGWASTFWSTTFAAARRRERFYNRIHPSAAKQSLRGHRIHPGTSRSDRFVHAGTGSTVVLYIIAIWNQPRRTMPAETQTPEGTALLATRAYAALACRLPLLAPERFTRRTCKMARRSKGLLFAIHFRARQNRSRDFGV